MDNAQWTMDHRRWTMDDGSIVIGRWCASVCVFPHSPSKRGNMLIHQMSPSGGGRGRMGAERLRTYGTRIILSFGSSLQSFCHYVAILANRFGNWMAEYLPEDTVKSIVQCSEHIKAMPHRCKSFLALVQPTFLYLPLRGKTLAPKNPILRICIDRLMGSPAGAFDFSWFYCFLPMGSPTGAVFFASNDARATQAMPQRGKILVAYRANKLFKMPLRGYPLVDQNTTPKMPQRGKTLVDHSTIKLNNMPRRGYPLMNQSDLPYYG